MPPPLTLNMIRRARPCEYGWRKLLAHLGKTAADDEPISLATILDSNGLDDALWCLRALPDEWDNRCRLLACDFAEPALAFVPEGEDRPRQAIAVARRRAVGDATQSELVAASAAAKAAALAAARDAALAAAKAAARHAARDAALAAARHAAWAAEGAEARAAARDEQTAIFRDWIKQHEA